MARHHLEANPAERATRRRRALLIVTAPTWLWVCERAWLGAAEPSTSSAAGAALGAAAACLLQLAAGLSWTDGDRTARVLAAGALLVGAVTGTVGAADQPGSVLALWTIALCLGAWLLARPMFDGIDERRRGNDYSDSTSHDPTSQGLSELRAAVVSLLALWLLQALLGASDSAITWASSAASLGFALVLGLPTVRSLIEGFPLRTATITAAWILSGLGAWRFGESAFSITTWLLVGPLATLAWTYSVEQASAGAGALDELLRDPARLMLVTFAGGGLLGGVALSLPVAAAGGAADAVPPIDAFFTSFSAICVTGLAVFDPGSVLSPIGQVLLLGLIQVGGLGILTFSTGAMLLARRRLSLRHESAVAELVGAEHRGQALESLRRMLLVTFGTEAIAALLLTGLFLKHGDSPGMAVWRGAFTAISAFCNAGFALQVDGLVPYASDPAVLHVVAATIVLGGLGPAVVTMLPQMGRQRLQPAIWLAIYTSLLLIFVPAILFLALEWSHSLANLSWADRFHNALFQSVTTRTAGFNSVDMLQLRPATASMFMILMFVGGSPASTAGGIKTTTAAVLTLSMFAALRGRTTAEAFGYQLSHATVYRAGAVASAGIASVAAVVVALQLTQSLTLEQAAFEAVSALGTVGLTIGTTPLLDDVGKIIIMIAMYAGRVGPLTLFVLLTSDRDSSRWKRPEASVPVG